jgi:hypothetical protein
MRLAVVGFLVATSVLGCRGLLGIETLTETDDGGPPDAAHDATTGPATDAPAMDAASGESLAEASSDGSIDGSVDASVDAAEQEASTNVFVGPPVCAPSGWCFAHPLPQGNDLYAVWGTSSSDVWAVGDRETVLHFDGNVWSGAVLASGTDNLTAGTLYGVWADDHQNAWAVGMEYGSAYPLVLFHDGSTDAGAFAWSRVALPAVFGVFYAVWGDPSGQYVLTAGSGPILRFNRTTLQWSQDTAPTNTIEALWGTDASNVWAVGISGTILNNTGGTTWTQASLTGIPAGQNYYGIWGDAQGKNIWIVGQSGVVIHGNTAGWTQVPVPTDMQTVNLYSVWGDAAGHVWVAGGGTILASRVVYEWDGSSWSTAFVGPCTTLCNTVAYRGVWGDGASNLWAVGRGGSMAHRDANGWTTSPSATNTLLRGLWGSSPTDVWAVSSTGATIHGVMSEWSIVPNVDGGTFASVWGSGPNDVYAAGNMIAHYDGTTWSLHSQVPDGGISAIWGSGPDDIWAGGSELLHSVDGGAFAPAPFVPGLLTDAGSLPPIQGLWGTGPSDVWAVGGASGPPDYGYAAHYDGQSWTLDPGLTAAEGADASPGILFGVSGAPSGDLFFAGESAALQRTSAGTGVFVLPGSFFSNTTFPGRVTAQSASNVWLSGSTPSVVLWDGGALDSVTTCMNPQFSMPAMWSYGNQVWLAGARGDVIYHP